MPKFNSVYTEIVPADSPIFSAHTYSEVYGGGSGCSAIINGTSITVAAGSSLEVLVRTISGGTGCFLLGDKNDVYQGTVGLGGIY